MQSKNIHRERFWRGAAVVGLLCTLAACDKAVLGGGGTGEAGPGGDTTGDGDGDQASSGARGTLTLRRLNRVEYDNTVIDLLDTSLRPGASFPPENLDEGFDVIGEALTVQPLHLELFEQSASSLVEELFSRVPTDPIYQATLPCDYSAGDRACLEETVRAFAERAFRRPVDGAELTSTFALLDEGSTAGEGLALALQSVLLSPHFIYRVEIDADPNTPATHPISAYELATRLSYFLWSTAPDDTLLSHAADGSLLSDEVLRAQIERLLADEKSEEFVSNFAGQWLNLRRVEQVAPDYNEFPEFDDDLRAAMRRETELFFREVLDRDEEIGTLLTAPFTYVNDRLAAHYGLAPVGSQDHVRIDTTGSQRRGLLAHGSFLTLTSNPTRTSPVKRGKWVMDQLLCEGPPPPPPGVEADLEAVGTEDMSVRERLAIHRESPACAQCHMVMDPIGLSFENFDAIGAFRTADNSGPIDASGILPTADGDLPFNGPEELASILADDPRLLECVVQKLLTYGVGRKMKTGDDELITTVAEATRSEGGSLKDAIVQVVLSEGFRTRRAGE